MTTATIVVSGVAIVASSCTLIINLLVVRNMRALRKYQRQLDREGR